MAEASGKREAAVRWRSTLFSALVMAATFAAFYACDRALETWGPADEALLLGVSGANALVLEIRHDSGGDLARPGAGRRLLLVDARTGTLHARARVNDAAPLLLRAGLLWLDRRGGPQALDPNTLAVVHSTQALVAAHPQLASVHAVDEAPCVDARQGRLFFRTEQGERLSFDLERRSLEPAGAPCEAQGARTAFSASLAGVGRLTASGDALTFHPDGAAPSTVPLRGSPRLLLAPVGDAPLVVDGDVFVFADQGFGHDRKGAVSRVSLSDLRAKWTTTLPLQEVRGGATSGEVLLLAGSLQLFAVDLASGAVLWTRP